MTTKIASIQFALRFAKVTVFPFDGHFGNSLWQMFSVIQDREVMISKFPDRNVNWNTPKVGFPTQKVR